MKVIVEQGCVCEIRAVGGETTVSVRKRPRTITDLKKIFRADIDTTDVRLGFGGDQAWGWANDVKTLREKHGWTQSELARKCRCDQSYIAHVERGKKQPNGPISLILEMLIAGTPVAEPAE